jgi:hypothetical protein
MKTKIIIATLFLGVVALICYSQTQPIAPLVLRFLLLTDVDETTYVGAAGKYMKVNAGETAVEFGTPAGAGDLLADGSVPMTANWDIGNYDITLKSLTGDGSLDFGNALSVELVQSAAPVTNATGEIALDTSIPDHQPLWQYYDGGENMTIIAIDTAQLPALDNEIPVYDAGTDKWILETVAGGGDMLKATYDADTDDLIDQVAGGTELDTSGVTDGQLLIGTTAANVWAIGTLTGTANEIDITNAGGSITVGLVNPLVVSKGGTGTTTFTDGGILLGSGAGAITALGVATNGQIPIGDGATDPVLATISEGLAIDITNAAGSITAAFDPTELLGNRTWGDASTDTIVWTWNRATGADPTMTFGNGFVSHNGDLKILGDDLYMTTNTDKAIFVGDGTNFNPVVSTGDVIISNDGSSAIQANAVDDTHIDWGTGANQVAAADIPMAVIAGSTYSTVQDMQNLFHSAGWISGNGIVDDTDGTITVASGTGFIRAADSAVADILFIDWSAESGANVNIADNDISWVYVEYNVGSPRVIATTTERTDYNRNILLAVISREGTTLHINEADLHKVGDHANLMIKRLKGVQPYGHVSGAIISATGTRNFAFTAGNFWRGLTEFNTDVFDSNPGGDGDTFSYFYRKVADSGWNEVATQSAINNTQYDDNSGALATLSNNKYGVHWVYLQTDNHTVVIYGQGNYSLAEAEDAAAPASVPEELAVHGILAGKIIIEKSDAAFAQIESAFKTTFAGSLATDHGSLAGLADAVDHAYALLIDGTRDLAGAWNMASQATTNVNIDSGTIDHEAGGLEADVSGYSGLIAVSGGSTSEVDDKSELESQIADVADFAEADGDIFTGVHDFGGASSFEIVNGTDPDVAVIGQLHLDIDGANEPNDMTLRTFEGAGTQYLLARTLKTIQATIIKPQDLANATRDLTPIWHNGTGMVFTITEIWAWSDTDDTSVNVEVNTATDFTVLGTVDALEIATDGTGVFYVTETTITDPTIAHDEVICLDFDDTDDPGWVKIAITGWFNSDID